MHIQRLINRLVAAGMLGVIAPSTLALDNKQIAMRFEEAFAAGDSATLKKIVAEDVVDHNSPPGTQPGRQGLLDAVSLYHEWFSDLQITVEQQVGEGDLVVNYGLVNGTNTGQMMGADATGKPAKFAYIDICRIVDGIVVETWHVEDIAGLLTQLGAAH